MRSLISCLILCASAAAQTVTIEPAIFAGSGLNDASSGGRYNPAAANALYVVTISASGMPDHFTWTKNGGTASPATAIIGGSCATPAIAGTNGWQTIADGVLICWRTNSGHVLAANWTIFATARGAAETQSTIKAAVGAKFRLQEDVNRDTLSVLDFAGVDPTGTTDSHDGLQAAIDAANQRELHWVHGSYTICKPLIIKSTATNFSWIGDGKTNTILQPCSADIHQGNGRMRTPNPNTLVINLSANVVNGTIRGIRFHNGGYGFTGTGIWAWNDGNSGSHTLFSTTIEDCWFSLGSTSPYAFAGGLNNAHILRNQMDPGQIMFKLAGDGIVDVDFDGNQSYGAFYPFIEANTDPTLRITVDHSTVEAMGGLGGAPMFNLKYATDWSINNSKLSTEESVLALPSPIVGLAVVDSSRKVSFDDFTVDSTNSIISTPVFAGSGLDDGHSNNFINGATVNDETFVATISATGTPDYFTWTRDGGSPSSPVAIVGGSCTKGGTGWQNLADGAQICWLANTGHKTGANWTIQLIKDQVFGVKSINSDLRLHNGTINNVTTDAIYVTGSGTVQIDHVTSSGAGHANLDIVDATGTVVVDNSALLNSVEDTIDVTRNVRSSSASLTVMNSQIGDCNITNGTGGTNTCFNFQTSGQVSLLNNYYLGSQNPNSKPAYYWNTISPTPPVIISGNNIVGTRSREHPGDVAPVPNLLNIGWVTAGVTYPVMAMHGSATAPGKASITTTCTSSAVPSGGGTPVITCSSTDAGHTHAQQ